MSSINNKNINALIERSRALHMESGKQLAHEISFYAKQASPHGKAIVDSVKTTAAKDEIIFILMETLEQVNKMLTIPAAEYVPTIPDAWTVIEKAFDTADKLAEKAMTS